MPLRPASPTLRLAGSGDEPFLREMLFYAAHMHDEPGKRIEDLLAMPTLTRYFEEFGRPGDLGIVADDSRGPLGAAWVRVLAGDERGYGWVDDETPELAIAVRPGVVGEGVGTCLLNDLLARAKGRYPGVSLSVRSDNPARRLYVRLGFAPVAQVINRVGGASETMVLRFGA